MDPEHSAIPALHHPEGHRVWKYSNLFSVIAMGTGSIGYGYSANVISGSLAQPTFLDYFRLETRSNGTAITAAMTAMYYVGGAIAAFSIGWLSEKYGRKWTIAVSAIATLISGAFLAGSVNVTMFIVFRFFSGAGGNLLSATVPIWMSEVVPAKNRGLLVDFHGALYVFGYMVAAWMGYAFYFAGSDTPDAWRVPFAIQCIPPLVLLSGIYWLPESPRWLLMKDRHEDAQKVLLRLHSPDEAAVEYVQIAAQMRIDKDLDTSFMHMLRKPSYRKRFILSICAVGFNQFSGILVITNYATTIYKNLGYGTTTQLMYNGAWQTLSLGCAVMGIFFVDRMPRPYLLILGLGGCTVCLTLEAALVARFADSTNTAALKAAVAMMFLYVFFFQGCLNGTQWAYVAELWPSHMRPMGLATALVTIMLTNICFVEAAPTAFASIGWHFYLLFIIPSACFLFIIYFTFPDTKGLPLEDIGALFGDTDELYRLDSSDIAMADRKLNANANNPKSQDQIRIEQHETRHGPDEPSGESAI